MSYYNGVCIVLVYFNAFFLPKELKMIVRLIFMNDLHRTMYFIHEIKVYFYCIVLKLYCTRIIYLLIGDKKQMLNCKSRFIFRTHCLIKILN